MKLRIEIAQICIHAPPLICIIRRRQYSYWLYSVLSETFVPKLDSWFRYESQMLAAFDVELDLIKISQSWAIRSSPSPDLIKESWKKNISQVKIHLMTSPTPEHLMLDCGDQFFTKFRRGSSTPRWSICPAFFFFSVSFVYFFPSFFFCEGKELVQMQ